MPGEPATPPAGAEEKFNLNTFLTSILAQNSGDKDAAIRQLGREGYKLRQKLREERKISDDLKKKLPAEGTVVLVGDDAKHYAELQKLGRPIPDVLKDVAELPTLREQVTGMEREKGAARAATYYGWTQPDVLLDQINSRSLELSFRKTKVKDDEGNDVEQEVPHVRKKGNDKESWTPLKDFVDTNLPKAYLVALTAKDDAAEGDEGEEESRFVPAPGSRPAARNRDSGKVRDVVGQQLSAKYSLPGEDKASSTDGKKK